MDRYRCIGAKMSNGLKISDFEMKETSSRLYTCVRLKALLKESSFMASFE